MTTAYWVKLSTSELKDAIDDMAFMLERAEEHANNSNRARYLNNINVVKLIAKKINRGTRLECSE